MPIEHDYDCTQDSTLASSIGDPDSKYRAGNGLH